VVPMMRPIRTGSDPFIRSLMGIVQALASDRDT
jgi:hypothetical protein